MKKIILVATALVLFFSQAALAAENTGFYLGVSGGYVIPLTMTISDPDDSSNHLDTSLKNGYLGGIKIGWNTPFTKRIMAMELEYNYIFGTDFDKDKVISEYYRWPATFDGTIKIHALLFNLKARYPEGRFHPYIGGGIGGAYFQMGDVTVRQAGGPGLGRILGASGTGLCYQFLVGLDFDITPHLGMGIGYKFFGTYPTIGSKTDGAYGEYDYKASVFTLGLTYTF